jgi:hypothetical protein
MVTLRFVFKVDVVSERAGAGGSVGDQAGQILGRFLDIS